MTEFFSALGLIAPYYNLVLVVILFFLFLKLFATPKKNHRVFLTPWVLVFVALIIFVIEELLTILRTAGLLNIPAHINGFFELGMICIFIYTLLSQKDWMKKHSKKTSHSKSQKKSVKKKSKKSRKKKR